MIDKNDAISSFLLSIEDQTKRTEEQTRLDNNLYNLIDLCDGTEYGYKIVQGQGYTVCMVKRNTPILHWRKANLNDTLEKAIKWMEATVTAEHELKEK